MKNGEIGCVSFTSDGVDGIVTFAVKAINDRVFLVSYSLTNPQENFDRTIKENEVKENLVIMEKCVLMGNREENEPIEDIARSAWETVIKPDIISDGWAKGINLATKGIVV